MNDVQAKDFGKVAVLMGGWAAEREVSLVSGQAVLEGLLARDIDAHALDMNRNVVQQLTDGGFDRVFNVVHGRGGEDGEIQGALELLGLPYTGSDVLGSALAMDKYRTKLVWQALDLPTPGFALIEDQEQLVDIAEMGFPLMIKAALEGSSIGIARAENLQQLQKAWDECSVYDSHVIAEQWVEGDEYTVSILGDRALPIIRLETPHVFYDYKAKYQDNDTQYHVPCGLSRERESALKHMCLEAFRAVGASGWGRVDLMIDAQGRAWLIEVNTVPGMTSHSLVPMAAKSASIDFDELVWQVLAQTLEVENG